MRGPKWALWAIGPCLVLLKAASPSLQSGAHTQSVHCWRNSDTYFNYKIPPLTILQGSPHPVNENMKHFEKIHLEQMEMPLNLGVTTEHIYCTNVWSFYPQHALIQAIACQEGVCWSGGALQPQAVYFHLIWHTTETWSCTEAALLLHLRMTPNLD